MITFEAARPKQAPETGGMHIRVRVSCACHTRRNTRHRNTRAALTTVSQGHGLPQAPCLALQARTIYYRMRIGETGDLDHGPDAMLCSL